MSRILDHPTLRRGYVRSLGESRLWRPSGPPPGPPPEFVGMSYASSGGAGGVFVPRPAGTANGDLLIAASVYTASSVGATFDSGAWSPVAQHLEIGNGELGVRIYFDAHFSVANNTPANIKMTPSPAGSVLSDCMILAYRGAAPALVGSVNAQRQAANTSHPSGAVVTTPNARLVSVGIYFQPTFAPASSVTAAGATERTHAPGSPFTSTFLRAFDLVASGSPEAVTVVTAPACLSASCLLAVAPA